MSRSSLIVMWSIVALVVGLSLVPYGEKTNPKSEKKLALQAPQKVIKILKKSCFDCHSNETKWPWYSDVFPLAWSIKDHVKNARASLNFSLWESYSEKKQKHLKEEIYRKTGRVMPLAEYMLFHSEAKLTPDEIKTVREWAEQKHF